MYKRIFSKGTAYAAFLCTVLLTIGECATGMIAGGMTQFEYFDMTARLLLSVFLFAGYRKHNIPAIQGGCSGLLICMMYSQANFLLNNLLYMSADEFVILGFWGIFYLAGELMLMLLEIILTMNHFELFILKKKNSLKIYVNQLTTVIMLAFLLFQTFVVTQITIKWRDLAYYGLFNFGLIAVFILIVCAELTLALDDDESKG